MPRPARPVVVVGAGLAALATAARLAKAGYQTTLLPDGEPLGGGWAPGPDDRSPTTLAFPAPWRDLFRKSGRPVEDELARSDLALLPSPGPLHRFADRTELVLGGRGDSHAAVRDLADGRTADAWQDLVDRLSSVWQQLRFLGLETQLRDAGQLSASVRAAIWADRSLADLAADLPDPRLAALVADLAATHGSSADHTPAWAAVSLFIERTFGHWAIVSKSGDPQPMSVLVDLLRRRLELRRVDVVSQVRVASLSLTGRGTSACVDGVLLGDGGRLPAESVVIAEPPWRHYASLPTGLFGGLPAQVRREAAALGHCRPALAPALRRTRFEADAGPSTGPIDVIEHGAGPEAWGRTRRISRRREPVDPHTGETESVMVELDSGRSAAEDSAGISWDASANWLDRPPTASALPGLFLAGAWSRSGAGPDRDVLSAALAAGAVLALLDPS